MIPHLLMRPEKTHTELCVSAGYRDANIIPPCGHCLATVLATRRPRCRSQCPALHPTYTEYCTLAVNKTHTRAPSCCNHRCPHKPQRNNKRRQRLTQQRHDDLAGAVIVHDLELADVTCGHTTGCKPVPAPTVKARPWHRASARSNQSRANQPSAPAYGRQVASDAPCFIITCRNLTITLELGRMSTWRFPRFSAFEIALVTQARQLSQHWGCSCWLTSGQGSAV
jgi:hypothetical protein|eukprot:COSAG06_NODE_205_length_20281_cov_6.904448_10_plen_225_part_00